jgi:hypothetical protein
MSALRADEGIFPLVNDRLEHSGAGTIGAAIKLS